MTTFLAAMRSRGLTAPLVRRSRQREIFLAYVRQQLVPTLADSDVVIMDSLSSHKRVGLSNV